MSELAKQCAKCKEVKSSDCFFITARSKGRLHSYCQACVTAASTAWHRGNPERSRAASRASYARKRADPARWKKHLEKNRRLLLRQYGLTPEQYEALYNAQRGLCAICGKPPYPGRGGMLCVDHDHVTGEIRGLLHRRCNAGLGALGDDPVQASLNLAAYSAKIAARRESRPLAPAPI